MNSRICIINEIGDKQVMVNDEIVFDVDFTIDDNIDVIQWYGDHGYIEYHDDTPTEKFEDFTPFLHVIDDKEKRKQAIKDELKAEADAEIARQQAVVDAMTYADFRRMEYPSIEDQLEAMYDERVLKDKTKQDEIDAKIEAVKLKYPKDYVSNIKLDKVE